MLELRPFQSSDYDALISWFPTEADLRDFAGPGVRWPLDRAQLDDRVAEPGLQAWSAWVPQSADPVGHVELLRIESDQARIDRVAIASAHRGRGLALQLVRAALAQVRDSRVRTVDLLVFADNAPAVRTYLAAGFTDVGAVSPDYPAVRRMSLNRPALEPPTPRE